MFIPSDSLPSPSTIVSGDIPGTVRSWYHGQTSMPGTLVLCLPQIKIVSAGHKYMEPLQEIPFVIPRPILEEGTFLKNSSYGYFTMFIIFYTDIFSFTAFFFLMPVHFWISLLIERTAWKWTKWFTKWMNEMMMFVDSHTFYIYGDYIYVYMETIYKRSYRIQYDHWNAKHR